MFKGISCLSKKTLNFVVRKYFLSYKPFFPAEKPQRGFVTKPKVGPSAGLPWVKKQKFQITFAQRAVSDSEYLGGLRIPSLSFNAHCGQTEKHNFPAPGRNRLFTRKTRFAKHQECLRFSTHTTLHLQALFCTQGSGLKFKTNSVLFLILKPHNLTA
jgi:hypothetical protein